MIVLDTNVISELMRRVPHAGVLAWIGEQPRTTLYTTSINQAEIFYGIEVLSSGRRRQLLAEAAAAMFDDDFAGRVLSFGPVAVAHYAAIVAARRKSGNPIEAFDALIAATARAAGASVATRDIRGFDGCGVALIDPWQDL